MPTRESHALDKKRNYEGESSAEAFIEWLNVTEDTEARTRIEAIWWAFIEAAHFAAKDKPRFKGEGGRMYAERTPEAKHTIEANERIQDLMRYYTVVPYVYVYGRLEPTGEVQTLVGWDAVVGSRLDSDLKAKRDARRRKPSKALSERPGSKMGELAVLHRLLELIESGLIARIGQCKCGKFYFRRFVHHNFCSQKCRVAASRNSDDARAKRAAYARKLYQLHKTGNVK
ncbi:MAG: hypothetical protein M3O31_11015 [Acidobacteriota bacterium]|nr:hypothetical protein [Acidobacteriota bacterium]